jgi:hypothetical protein
MTDLFVYIYKEDGTDFTDEDRATLKKYAIGNSLFGIFASRLRIPCDIESGWPFYTYEFPNDTWDKIIENGNDTLLDELNKIIGPVFIASRSAPYKR